MFSLIWNYIIPFLFVLTVLVFVHELGHYLAARWNGVRVEVFSIGFGPELFGRTDKHGTRWRVAAIPLGGYVKMLGEQDWEPEDEAEHPIPPEAKAESFGGKGVAGRASIVAAGPLANFLFAIVVFTGLFGVVGNPQPLAVIGDVQPASAAAAAGLQKGDRIVEAAGEAITWFEDLRRVISVRPGVETKLLIERDGKAITVTATPQARGSSADPAKAVGLLGVRPDPEKFDFVKLAPWDAAVMAVSRSYDISAQIFTGLAEIIRGTRSGSELGGPLRIAQISGEVAAGGWLNMLSFLAAFSINLGLLNLFPVPMLDGGHLFFYGIEALRGKPLAPRAQEYGFRFGLILVLALMVYATWNDLVHLRIFEFLKGLVG